VAVNDDNQERDLKLTRLYQAASGEEPPAALDTAILSAARRAVHARPQAAGSAGEMPVPIVRAKRNWYVPVSIAAVLVLSVSLATLVHEEKGDELAQSPRRAPATAEAPTAAAKAPTVAVPPQAADGALHDVPTAPPKIMAEKRVDAARSPQAAGDLAQQQREKQHAQAETAATESSATVFKSAPARREMPTAGRPIDPDPAAPAPGAAPVPPPAPMQERRSEPFPATSERKAPGVAKRDAAPVATLNESDGRAVRDTTPSEPKSAPLPPAPREAFPAEDARNRGLQAQGRAVQSPAPMAAKPAFKRDSSPPASRPAWFAELENQPPEKWLERLAEFKRDVRNAEADELLVEFRRRFPDHPASAR